MDSTYFYFGYQPWCHLPLEDLVKLSSNDDKFRVRGYNLIQEDHPGNTKGGGISINHRKDLKGLDIQFLKECISIKLKNEGGLCNFLCL